ncbi:glycerol dehydrogenase [Serinibacter salmoneus]|uniref:Glycerol dehydrogenase n=1 Tax=Serinibacter salmoneus TaxID=556530 RepID=A0A2A9CY24_9MICO|nr:glycerol dehydrogenase [Serinibacter salmoneus]PFG18479.1 glycerol 2-dehydrogenase (NAD+) [Serinibacter salmoneus]
MSSHLMSLIAPARYVQGRDAIASLGDYVKQIGERPLVLVDDVVWGFVGDALTSSFQAAGLPTERMTFAGYCTAEQIDRIAERVRATGSDVLVGVGGGSAIDAAKAAGHIAGIRWASVPTVASTDAPCSALSVVYTAEGAFEEYRFFPHNPDLVLVDSQIVANAPVRMLVGGLGDALATWQEARLVAEARAATMAGALPTTSGTALAKLSWDMLHENALAAIDAVRHNIVTPALERVIEANTLLSGVGFESGGLAAAHAIHNGLTAAPSTHGLTHGEKVNIGTLTQFVLEGAPSSEIEDFIVFTTKVGLPNTLTEIGIAGDDVAGLRQVAELATAEGETIHAMPFEVRVPDLVDALRSIEPLATRVRAEAGLAAPAPFGH